MYAGPSPRIRAFASHETLSFRRWAASLGVSSTGSTIIAFSDNGATLVLAFEFMARRPRFATAQRSRILQRVLIRFVDLQTSPRAGQPAAEASSSSKLLQTERVGS